MFKDGHTKIPNSGVGVKGRSGRKNSLVEFNKAQTIKKAWVITDENLDKQGSLQIVLKDMAKDDNTELKVKIELSDELKKYANIADRGIEETITGRKDGDGLHSESRIVCSEPKK